MEALSNNEGDLRKVSLLSMDKIPLSYKERDKLREEQAPPDRFYLTHIMFFFFALGGAVPYTFFYTAQDYWMYKFRDVNYEDYDLKNKTMLQKNFGTISSLCHTIPGILTTVLTSYYGHKINIYTRMTSCLSTILVIFLIFTAFIEVNTDPWQLEFFILTIVVSTGVTVSMNLLSVTHLAMIAKFPTSYLKTQMYGGACSSILGALLQILCLFLGNGSHQRTALIYFLCGVFILGITVTCSVMCKYVPRFAYFVGDTVADTTRRSLTMAEVKDVSKLLWPNIVMFITGLLTAGMAPVALYVPENYGHGDAWSDRYFTPVISFLWQDILGLVARYFSFPLLTRNNAVWYVLVDTTRLIILHPLVIFCNFLPRNHLPVLFPHDWEYISLLSVNNVLGTFFGCCTFMSMKNMLGDKAEQGFLLMATIGTSGMFMYSILSTFWVNIM